MVSRRFGLAHILFDRNAMTVGFLFLGTLALSILLFLFAGNSRVERVFFFPSGKDAGMSAESRFVPNHGDVESDIREFVEGEILGPVSHDFKLLLPREVTVQGLFVRKRVLYVDLSTNFAVLGQDLLLGKAAEIEALKRAISFNFPGIREIVLRVGGQTPVFTRTEKIR